VSITGVYDNCRRPRAISSLIDRSLARSFRESDAHMHHDRRCGIRLRRKIATEPLPVLLRGFVSQASSTPSDSQAAASREIAFNQAASKPIVLD